MFIPDPDLDFLHIPDPGSKGHTGNGYQIPDPGSGSATLLVCYYVFSPGDNDANSHNFTNETHQLFHCNTEFQMLSWVFEPQARFVTRPLTNKHTVYRMVFFHVSGFYILVVDYFLLVPVSIHTDRNLKFNEA